LIVSCTLEIYPTFLSQGLALSGIQQIHVIDLDTIDISNLNRQFLFRMKDVGRNKSEVAAEFIMERVAGCQVTAHVGKIQDKDLSFYKQFDLIISGLDNTEARRWLNSVVVGFVKKDKDGNLVPETIIPLVDGGTEGLKGQGRIILPKVTPCFECTIESFPPPKAVPFCTGADTPRNAEHCIIYAYVLEWDKHFPAKQLDKDSPQDMQWVYERALERANTFGISGVTYFKTLGVVKNIIPAVASTNAVIASVCVSEAMKYLSFCSQTVNNYMMYMGGEGVYTPTFVYDKKEDCLVCADTTFTATMNISPYLTLQDLIDRLINDPQYQLKQPALTTTSTNLYLPSPPVLEKQLRPNLTKFVSDLIEDGEVITVTDSMLSQIVIFIEIHFDH
jgi:ubiquitin-activating enzyme E1 C